MKFRLLDKQESIAGSYTQYSATINASAIGLDSLSCTAVLTVDTPSAKTFTADATTNIFTAAANGLSLGTKLQVSNGGGALPTGLSAGTDYFAIPLTANTFQLATSLANALAGTAIDITTAGTGTQTETPTAIAGGTIGLQESNLDVSADYTDVAAATAVSATGVVYLSKDRPTANFYRVKMVLTAGHITGVLNILGKGDKD